MKTVTTIIAAIAFAGAAFAQTVAKAPKKILAGASSLNHVSQLLIEKLKENGCDVVLVGPTDIEKVDVKPYPQPQAKEGTVKADYTWGTFPPDTLKDYSAFIFTRTESADDLKLPMEQILRSGKLVVLGESPNTEAGEKLLLGGPVNWNYKCKAYQITGTQNRINYIVYRANQSNSQSEEGHAKFVEKLVPRILQNL